MLRLKDVPGETVIVEAGSRLSSFAPPDRDEVRNHRQVTLTKSPPERLAQRHGPAGAR